MMNNTLPVEAKATDTDTEAGNTAVVLTYAANAERHVIGALHISYSNTPTGGAITIENGAGVIVFDADITVGGLTVIPFNPPLAGSPNTAMIITLAAGGGTVVGTLNARHWLQN
jgi:hypothetical protein